MGEENKYQDTVRQSLAIKEAILGEHEMTALAHEDLGMSLTRSQQWAAASTNLMRGLELRQKLGLPADTAQACQAADARTLAMPDNAGKGGVW